MLSGDTCSEFVLDMGIMESISLPKKTEKKIVKYNKDYDSSTEKYKTYRRLNIDPISLSAMEKDYPFFEVYRMWDPYTGEFSEKNDPFGSLKFDPISLTIYFWMNRYRHLLKDSDGVHEMATEDGLGATEQFKSPRGVYPEKYLWRLPVIDCYIEENKDPLEKSFIGSIPKVGPKLTKDDIVKIYELVKKCVKVYPKRLKRIPDLLKMYDTYHEAINPNPDISKIKGASSNLEAKNMANVIAAHKLVEM